ncbi:hypothetical protein [Mucilaginibacter glaciei]|uniref:TonB-dependent receptor plug domain-containing protein n=1 Tax=Mucilaginibacter glaciei TaxID=2772109 RepID=A0A926NKF3_9SPHI|nr:hypothetical protein [Mucilaginibacter glaciei]MBD1392871.1 hypothetical protein [Mucilaginibacter glaciei]
MNRLPVILICFIANLLCTKVCLSQTVAAKVSTFLQQNPQEKIYIHYDKNSYVTGDTVWFKAYLFSGSQRSHAGKNFYLELVNEQGKLLKRLTAPIFESTASGNIILPADTSANTIYCRAYTEAMLKSDSSFIYNKMLPVINLKQRAGQTQSGQTISFLPEGGNWIDNVPALVAFKATNADGLPFNVNGVIKSDDKIVTEFATTHDGMGFFTLSPQPKQIYKAVWKDATGQEHTTPLPLAEPIGVSIHIANISTGKKFYVFRSGTTEEPDKVLTLVVHANGTIFYQAELNLSTTTMASGTIPVKDLPTGILYFTVFNKNTQPVAERISFINNHDYTFDVAHSFATLNKNKRGLNEIRLAITDTIRSNLSLSITDAEIDPHSADKDNIISHLLLTGDLRGKIVNPYYYFTNNTEIATGNLDLVMLTHGWRKFNWENGPAKSDTIPSYAFLSIKGNIGKWPSFKTDVYASAVLQLTDTNTVVLPMLINKEGYFFRDGLIYYGDAKLYFKFDNKSLNVNNLKINFRDGLVKTYPYPFLQLTPDTVSKITAPATLPARLQDYLFQLKNTRELKEVQIKSTKVTDEKKLEKTYTSGVFKDGISTNIKVGDDPRFLNYSSFFQYLQGKVPGLIIRDPLSQSPSAIWRNDPVYFFLNGFQVKVSDIREIAMFDFDYLKIYDPSMGGTFGAPGGVISVYTKRGKGFMFDGKSNKMFTMPGYTPVKEFFSPDYATGVVLSKPDLRTTLFWDPNIILNKNHPEQTVKFYNNDVTKKMKLIIEGINFDGKLVHIEKIF